MKTKKCEACNGWRTIARESAVEINKLKPLAEAFQSVSEHLGMGRKVKDPMDVFRELDRVKANQKKPDIWGQGGKNP